MAKNNGMRTTACLIALCLMAMRSEAMMRLPQADRPLSERFANPPAECRILKLVHMLPDDPAAQDSLISTLIEQGFGGMATNVSFQGYVEDEAKWKSFLQTVGKAKAAGMSLWLYDEKGYPSGTAGGITLRDHPEWEARGLLIADATSDGGPVNLDFPPGKLVSAKAYPIKDGILQTEGAVDLTPRDGKLAWDAPAGKWHVMIFTESYLYEGTHSAVSLADKAHYINLLMPEPTARFLEVTHDQYAKRLGNDLGKTFVSTFTDEPSLMSLFFNPMPYRVIPWSPNLPTEFKKRRGYALEPVLPMLIAESGEKGRKARYDFWLTVGELTSESFFGQIQNWCHKHNVASGGHLLLEEPLVTHVSLYGDFFRCTRRLDAPSIDCLTSIPAEVPWPIARLTSSVADLEGRTVTMSETSDHVQRYRPQGDQRPVRVVTEDEIRGTCNRLIVNGINTFTSYYSFAGLSNEQLVETNEWIGRCCTMLKGGHQVADIAVLYPSESLWPDFIPARHWATDSPEPKAIDETYHKVSNRLWEDGRDFTYVDSRAIAESKVQGRELVHGKLKWKVVILPHADTLPIKAWERLSEFVRSGGRVIAVGTRPMNSESEFPSSKVQAMFRNARDGFVFLQSDEKLREVLDSMLERDVIAGGPIRYTHRRIEAHEVYFLINDGDKPWTGKVKLAVKGVGEEWDPATGKMTSLESGGVDLSLGPYGGMLFRW